MIIDRLYFIKKQERTLAHFLSGIILLILLTAFFASFIFAEYLKNATLIIRIILALLCTISIGDIVSLIRGNFTIGYRIVRYIKYKYIKNRPLIVVPTCNAIQQAVCECINGKENGLTSLVHIYGFPDRGKTTTALFVLQGIFLNTYKSVTQIKKMMFIDCSINKEEVLALFETRFDRIKQFEDSIIILDNIETLGRQFIELNKELLLSNKNLFIIIEDSENGQTQIGSGIFDHVKQYDFNNNVLSHQVNDDIWENIGRLDKTEKMIFFAIYFSIYTNKYATQDLIASIIGINTKRVYKKIRKMQFTGPFAIFPFNDKYVYCNDSASMRLIPQRYVNDECYIDILHRCIDGPYFDYEGRWLCLILDSPDEILKVSHEKRLHYFNNSLSKGHFGWLYHSIEYAIKLVPEKERLFSYEYGVLSYYMGYHKQAFDLYNNYLGTLDRDTRMKVLIRIMESSHGSSSEQVMNQLQVYINQLKNEQDYALYADYWEAHIETEKGYFDICRLNLICRRLQENISIRVNTDYLYVETVKRTYTDLLRCHHILGIYPEKELEDKFISYLLSINKPLHDYYYNLYIMAFRLQYIAIPLLRFENQDSELLKIIGEANIYYEKAINSEYMDQKTRRALTVKQAELKMMLADADAPQAIHTVEQFLVHSQANNVDVHEAYAETLLAKFKIIDNRNLQSSNGLIIPYYIQDDINKHLLKARKIYQVYKNEYGVFRSDFITYLYKLYLASDLSSLFLQMEKFMSKFHAYQKEQFIWNNMKERYTEQRLSKMFILWCIKSYPIIMQ